MTLVQNSSIPLYQQLKDAITADIRNEKFPKGSRMLSELELEKKYSVSRITVRRAMKELCEEGLLVKKQGKGTFVMGGEINAELGKVYGFHDYMEAHGKKVESVVLERGVVKLRKDLAKEMQLSIADDVYYIRRVMSTDSVPVMIDSSYIPLSRLPLFDRKFDDSDSVFRILRDEYNVKFGKYYKVLKVLKAGREMAQLLDCSPGEPLFDLYKISYDVNEVPMHLSISYVRGEGTSYIISGYDSDHLSRSGIKWGF